MVCGYIVVQLKNFISIFILQSTICILSALAEHLAYKLEIAVDTSLDSKAFLKQHWKCTRFFLGISFDPIIDLLCNL